MVAPSKRPFVVWAGLALFLVLLLASCRVEVDTTLPAGTAYPGSTAKAVRPTSVPTRPPAKAPVTAPAPGSPASVPPTQVQVEAAFTLTIVHTGEVYGEVRPCG